MEVVEESGRFRDEQLVREKAREFASERWTWRR
jgi:hypothetical protein